MAKDSSKLDSIMERMGWKVREAQAVMMSKYDVTEVCGWLSKDGTFYFTGGRIGGANEMEKALKEAGYHVVERFATSE